MRFCVLLLTVASALAWPVQWSETDEQCPPMSDRLFESGSSYLLKYDASVTTLIQGTSHEVTGMNVDCDVLIEATSDCMLVLSTEKCNLKNVEGQRLLNSKQFSQDMSAHKTILKMDNGRVLEILAHEDEPLYILNIKRGIISTLQYDLREDQVVEQTTVNGNCTSQRTVIDHSRPGRVQEVSITTDLNNCTRPQQKVVTLSPTSFLTGVQVADKFINSTRVCSYELRDENVKKVNCFESHVFNPFSYDGVRGVQTFIQQELKFKEKGKINSVLKLKDNLIKKNLTFEFEEQQESAHDDRTHAEAILAELVKGSLEETQMDSARLFGEFVVSIRTLNYETLKALFDGVRTREVELEKTYMYDALLQCGSVPCFKVMNDLVIDESVPSPISDAIMYIMAFRQFPPLTLIEESLRVAHVHKRQSVLLPLSIMVHNYYIQQEETLKVARKLPDPLKETIRMVRDMLGRDCSTPDEIQGERRVENNRLVLLALKSIGNMGEAVQKFDSDEMYTTEQIVPRLKECIARKDLHHNISMAAIQAFRRFNIPSTDEKRVRTSLKEVLGDSSRKVHSRIAAYLMVMRSHPEIVDLEEIIEIMLNEPLMQVKAFVFSHIENVLESDEPLVQDLKRKIVAAMGNRMLPEYPKDPLRYSRNIEKSKAVNVPYLNKTMAAQMESNIIFDAEHYLPHHVMLNTTINVLGQSWNLFEAGVEMKGFESALEAIFGPMGYYPDDILGSIYKQMDTKILPKMWNAYTFLVEEAQVQIEDLRNTPYAEMSEKILEKLDAAKKVILEKLNMAKPKTTTTPQKESPMAEHMNEVLTQALPAEFEAKLNKIHEMIPQEAQMVHASVYLKMLGNELGYVSLEDIKALIPRLNFTVANIKTVAKKYAQEMMENVAQGIEKNITKSFIFLERDFIIPTSAGLPLNCSVNGSAVLSLRMRAALGMELIMTKAFASGRIAPSASIEVVGTMGVKVPVLGEASVMANATAYHASHVEGNITLAGPHLKLNLNSTQGPMNLLNFSTNYFLVKPDGGIQLIPGVQKDRVDVKKCVGVAKTVLGTDLCVSWAYPNASYVDEAPRFPITGPTSFNITLVNSDKALKTFTLEFLYKNMKKGGSPAKKTMQQLMKKKSATMPAEITDVILVNFTAPGETLRREISSKITFNRATYETKWNFSAPELQTYAFAGLLNLKNPKTNTKGIHLVANATVTPEYNASVSLTLKNVTTVEKTNLTAVFNVSVMELYFANVAQFVKEGMNVKASATNFYYWDNETPIYQQILFPLYNYAIRQDKYRQNTALVQWDVTRFSPEAYNVDAKALLSVFQQNLTFASQARRVEAVSYDNDMDIKFANCYMDYSILNSTLSFRNSVLSPTVTKGDFRMALTRNDKSIVYEHERIFSPKELNETVTIGFEKMEKTLKPSFEAYRDWTFLSMYGDSAFTTTKTSYNMTTKLCLRNETMDTMEPTPVMYMAYFNVSLPNPMSEERITYSMSGRYANESLLLDNQYSYWTQFNTTVPTLKLKTASVYTLMKSENDFVFWFNDTAMTMEEKPLFIIDSDLTLSKQRGNYLAFRTVTPVYNFTFNVNADKDQEKGWVLSYTTSHNNTLTDLLNVTQAATATLSREAMSLNGMFYHPWLQADMTNILTPSGPIKRINVPELKEFIVEAYRKTLELNMDGLKEMSREAVQLVLDSRLELTNSLRAYTPMVANLTLDNSFLIDSTMLHNVFDIEVNRSRCGSGLRVNTTSLINAEGMKTGLSYRVKGRRLPEISGNHTIQVLKEDESHMKVDVQNDFLFGSRFVNLTTNADYQIKKMNRPWRFEAINSGIKYNLTSPLMNSSMESGLFFDNFENITNFNGIEYSLNHNATSRWANTSTLSGIRFNGFRSLFNFDDISSALVHSFNSTLTNWTTDARFNLHNVRSLFNFDRLDAGAEYNMASRWSNVSTGAEYLVDGLTAPFAFRLIDGKIYHNITTPWSEMTTEGLLQFNNFISMFNFGGIQASGENKMVSSLSNWTNDFLIDFSNFRSLFNFDRVLIEAGNRMNSSLANSSNTGVLEVNNVRSIFEFDEVRSSAVHDVTTPLGNWTLGVGMDLNNFASLFKFDEATFGAKHNLTSTWYNTTTESELALRNMRSPFSFGKIMAAMEHNTNTSMGNWTTYSGISLNGFQSIFNFQSIDAALGHEIKSQWVNWTTNYNMQLDDVRSLSVFRNANSGFSTVLTSKWGNMTTNTGMQFEAFRSLLDFNRIGAFYNTFINSSIVNASHTFENEVVNSRGLFSFDSATSKMTTNVVSILGNAELSNNVQLNNFVSLATFRNIKHTLTVDVIARYVNATHFSELTLDGFSGIFTFGKVQHQLRSNLVSRFLNASMQDDLKLLNFVSLKQYESASLGVNHIVNSFIGQLELNQSYGISGMRDFMSFQKANANIIFIGEGPLGHLTLKHDQKIKDMSGMFKIQSATLTQEAKLLARFFNLTAVFSRETNQMAGPFKFQRINGSINYDVSTPVGTLKAGASTDLSNFKNMMKFRLINNTALLNMTSRFMNLTHLTQTEFHNSRRLMDFEHIIANTSTNFSSPIGKVATTSVAELNNFDDFFKFSLVRVNNTVNISNCYLNATSVHGVEFNNFRKAFTFERVNASSQLNLSTPLGVASNIAEIAFEDFTSLFNFRIINFTSRANASSKHVNATSLTNVTLNNFSSLTAFESIIALTKNNLNTPVFNTSGKTGIEMHNFASLFNFGRVNASVIAELTSKFINSSNEAAVEFINFTKLYTFERINATGKTNLSIPFINTTAVGSVGFHDFRNLIDFSRINSSIEANLTNCLANLTTSGSMELNNMSGFSKFELLNGTTRVNLNSILLNLTTATNMEINRMTGFARFQRMINNASMNVTSRLANMTAAVNSEVNNMTGLNKYERILGNASLNFTSKLANLSAGTGMEVNNMTGMMVYDRILANASMNFSSPIVSLNSSSNMEVNNMTGFSRFERIIGNASLNVTSQIANLTTGTNMLIRNMRGIGQFDQIIGNASLNFTSRVANISTQHLIEMNNFANPITFEKLNITSNMDVTSMIGKVALKGGVEAHNVKLLYTFDRVNGSIAATAVSKIANLTAGANLGLHGVATPTNFGRVEGDLKWDLVSKYITAGQNSMFLLDRFRDLRTFNGISGNTRIFIDTPVYVTEFRTNLNIDNAYNFVQEAEMLSEVITGNRYQVILRQTANNDRILLNATIPARGSLCAEGYLNPVGDELTMTLFHQKKDIKTIDLSLLLKLNNTGVIYSNVSWNPETLQAIKEFKNEIYNNLLEMVRNASNTSKVYLEQGLNTTLELLNQAVDVANTTYNLLNFTIYNPREAFQNFHELEQVQKLMEKWNVAIQKVNDTIRGVVNRMDFTTVESIIDSFKALEEVQRVEQIVKDFIRKNSKKMSRMIDANVEKVKQLIQEYTLKVEQAREEFLQITKDPEHLINVWVMKCIDMTVYDAAVKSYDLTQDYSLLALNYSKNFSRQALNYTKTFSRQALNYTLNFTEWAVNNTKGFTQLAVYKINNYAVLVYNYTMNVSKMALEFGRNYSDEVRVISEAALEYALYYKELALNKTELVMNVTRPYIVWVDEISMPYRVIAVEYAQQLKKDTGKKMVFILKNAKAAGKAAIKYAVIGYKTGLSYASNATAYVIEISKDPEHIFNRYLAQYLEGTIFQAGERAYYHVKDAADKWYLEAEVIYQKYYTEMEELINTTVEKLSTFVELKLNQFDVLSKNETHSINIYLRKYFEKNLFEIVELVKNKINVTRENGRILQTQFRQWLKKAAKQPFEVTKQEVKQFFNAKYEKAQVLIEEFLARDDVIEILEKIKKPLLWANQTRFQPLQQTIDEVKVILEEAKSMAKALYLDLTEREEYQQTMQVYRDFMAREDVTKVLEVAEKMMLWANQTRFQPLEVTREEIMMVLRKNSEIIREKIMTFPVESNVRKAVAFVTVLAEDTKVLAIKYIDLVNETYIIVMDVAEEKYLLVKEYAEEKYLLIKEYAVEQWRYLKEETTYVVRAEELLEQTKAFVTDQIEYTRNLAEEVKVASIEMAQDYITYVNGTMPGWFVRYYELNQIPFKAFIRYVTFLYDSQNRIVYVVRYVISEIPVVFDNGLNAIGQVGEHSYAMNTSHPISWASFRETPTLTEAQWNMIEETKDLIKLNLIEPSVVKIKEWVRRANETQQEIREYIEEVYNKPVVQQRISELREKIMQLKQNITEEYKKLPTLEELKDFDKLAEKYPVILEIKENLIELKENITEKIPTIEELKGNWTIFRQNVEDNLIVLRANIEDNLIVLRANIKGNWTIWRSYIEGNYTMLKENIIENYPVWKAKATEFLNNVTQKVEVIYELVKKEYPNAKIHAQNLIKMIKEKTLEVRAEIERVAPIWVEKAKELVQNLTDKANELYPVYVEQLRDLMENLRNKIDSEYPQLRIKVEEGIEKIKELIEYLKELRKQIPVEKILALRYYRPFSSEATALIFDSLHVLTFDNHLYEHPGYTNPECTYLMATDYVDKNFTLFSNQENIFLALKGVHMRINQDNVVYFNGAVVPQDISFEDEEKTVTIFHQGPWVNISSSYGVKVSCNSRNFMCSVSLSSWYHGKTRGLLGNLDREARTDRIKPNGENATDIIDFVNAYEVTHRPECQINRFNRPNVQVPGCSQRNRVAFEAQCMENFNSLESLLQPAFETFSPVEWLQECRNLADQCKDICTLTKGYTHLARTKEISVVDPCEQCGDRPVDSMWMERKVVNSADIVFVVSENKLFRGPEVLVNLNTLINKLDNTLRKASSPMENNMYGLAAFGSNGVHEGDHSHTINGYLMNTAANMPKGFESLYSEGDYPTDAFDAISLAATYRFRAGAAKAIILIVENERQVEKSYLTLAEVQQKLNSRGIILYVVSNYESISKKSAPGAPVGIKFDKTIITASKKIKEGVVNIPSGNYAKLAIATRGSIFRLDMLLSGNNELLSMLPKIIRNDALPIMSGSVERQCQCVINQYGLATVNCENIW